MVICREMYCNVAIKRTKACSSFRVVKSKSRGEVCLFDVVVCKRIAERWSSTKAKLGISKTADRLKHASIGYWSF